MTTCRTTTRKTRMTVVVAGVVVLAGLTGCSSNRVGTAAVIEGRTVSVDEQQLLVTLLRATA